MAPTKLIAGLMGPLMLAMGVALLLNRRMFPDMAAQLAQDYAVIFLSGILALLAGIAIVRVHNVWSGGWPVVVTVLGWSLIVSGLVRMWFPQMAAPLAQSFRGDDTLLLLAGLIILGLGAFLSFKAYGSTI
jgi:hypothetical protein